MRTTLVIDDDILKAVRALAQDRSVSIGAIISELARKGLAGGRRPHRERNGFPIIAVPDHARPITLEDVRRAEDEE